MINRRTLLQSSGLLASTALLTGASLVDRPRPQKGGDLPRRFVIFLEGNGTHPLSFADGGMTAALEDAAGGAVASNRDYGHDDPILLTGSTLSDARSLAPLASDGSSLSLVDRAAVVLGLSGSHVGGGHSTNYGALTSSPGGSRPAHATIDAILGSIPEVRGNTPFDVVRIGTGASDNPLNYLSCAFDVERPAPIILDPSASFSTLFGSVSNGQAADDFAARGELLEFALSDVGNSIGKLDNSTRGRNKLEAYEASLEEMIARDQQIEAMADMLLANKPPEPGELDPDPYASTAPLEILDTQVGIGIGALRAGLTNVLVVSMGSGGYLWSQQYPTLSSFYPNGDVIGGHDLRHAGGANYAEVLRELTLRYVAQMCRVARALAEVDEDGGTMLDNTLLLYMSDNGEKHHSNAEEWPMLMIGGNNMGFLTDGRSVAYPRDTHANNRQTSNVFNSLLHGAGEPTDDFGHVGPDTRIAEGPLDELWGA